MLTFEKNTMLENFTSVFKVILHQFWVKTIFP